MNSLLTGAGERAHIILIQRKNYICQEIRLSLEKRFFVLHLDDKDYRPHNLVEYEIQILDSQGRAIKSVYFSDSDASFSVESVALPSSVIDAARRQAKGKGEYVNEAGERISPF